MDTSKSSNLGKAYEYACLIVAEELISDVRPVRIIDNSSLHVAKRCFIDELAENEQYNMLTSARVGIANIIKLEPKLSESGTDNIELSLQPDNVAKDDGDIRDVLIIRRSIGWEIGVSVKHNHSALKHSRLSQSIDFGQKWMDTPCSARYFTEIQPIFDKLCDYKSRNLKWSDLMNKEDDIYIPLLDAFVAEFRRLQSGHNVVAKLVEYLVGSGGRDYYKMIYHSDRITIVPYNIHGTLHQPSSELSVEPTFVPLPDSIVSIDFKQNSKTTLILTMNNGWAISMRIHNASKFVEPSLKFDIQLQSKPKGMYYMECEW